MENIEFLKNNPVQWNKLIKFLRKSKKKKILLSIHIDANNEQTILGINRLNNHSFKPLCQLIKFLGLLLHLSGIG